MQNYELLSKDYMQTTISKDNTLNSFLMSPYKAIA